MRAVKTSQEIVGNRTKIKVVKNKVAPPFRVVGRYYVWSRYLKEGEVIDLGVENDIVDNQVHGTHIMVIEWVR